LPRTSKLVSLLLLNLCLATTLLAAEWQPLESEPILKRLTAIDCKAYPEADVVEVAWHRWVRYQPDGTYEEYFESYFKVLTDKGVRDKRQLVSNFDLAYNSTAFTLAEVIGTDGQRTVVDIDANTREAIDSGQLDDNIYDPDNRELVLSLPRLKPGDTVHFVMRDNFKKVRVPDSYSDYVNFESDTPIVYARYTVDAPEARPLLSIALKARLGAGPKASVKHADGRITYSWEVRDVPRYYEEPNMPPAYTQTQRVLVSTHRDWPELSRWYYNLCEPAMGKVTPAMRAKVAELTAAATDQEARLRALFKFVSQDVRYLGLTVEKDAPGYEPHAVDLTFERRAGVCRDKAALLVAMLRLGGFDAYPVLIMNGPRKDAEVPQPFFNHAIVAVKQADKTYRLMDPTDENTRDLFPAYLSNQSYLVADPKGVDLNTSPIEDYRRNLVDIRTSARLEAGGNLRATTVMDFSGVNDNAYRGYFVRQTESERRDFFERVVRQIWPGARLETLRLEPDDLMNTDKPLKASLSFSVSELATLSSGKLLLPLKGFGNSLGMVNLIIDGLGLNERRFSYESGNACGIRESFDIDLAGQVGALETLPTFATIDNALIVTNGTVNQDKGHLRFEREFGLKLTEYDPAQYRELKRCLINGDNDRRLIAAFAPPANGEAEVLLDDNFVTAIDAHNWQETRHVKIRVLNYAGKKRLSDIRVDYNPAWEKIEVLGASVTGTDGVLTKISTREINDMDAPWAGSAPRYPSGKTLIISLPAVAEGSLIDLAVRRSKFNRPLFTLGLDALHSEQAGGDSEGAFGLSPVLAGQDAVRLKRFTIDLPLDLAKQLKPCLTQAGPALSVKRQGNRVVYELSAEQLAALKPEGSRLPVVADQKRLSLGDNQTQAWATAVKAALPDDKTAFVATARARELVAGVSDPAERVRIIRDYVARSIRLVNIGLDDVPLEALSRPDVTLTSGYASQPDRTLLLGAMLKAAGFKPEYVLVSDLPPLGELEPTLREYAPACFTRLLVRVTIGGQACYLGDSDQYAPLGLSAHAGKAALNLNDGGIFRLETAPELSDRFDTEIAMQVKTDGRAELRVKRNYRGAYMASFVRGLKESTPEERRRRHLEELAAIRRGAQALGVETSSIGPDSAASSFGLSCPNYAIRQGSLMYFDIYGLITRLSSVGAENRRAAFFNQTPMRRQNVITVKLPKGRILSELPAARFDLPGGMIEIVSSLDEHTNTLTITQKIEIETAVLSPQAYASWLAAQTALEQPRLRTMVLELR